MASKVASSLLEISTASNLNCWLASFIQSDQVQGSRHAEESSVTIKLAVSSGHLRRCPRSIWRVRPRTRT
eukprot:4322511-Amphidinium_carterae.1